MGIRIALAGNPNCGKTTLFNALTGSNQYVGNWPGVTVEKKDGRLLKRPDVVLQDLPGIYSLSPYSLEEVITRGYLVDERPDAILDIVDGTNIERNLYLTTQLVSLGIPIVIAINMMDVVRKNGDRIDLKKLSAALKCPVVEISALKGTGVDEAVEAVMGVVSVKHTGEPPRIFRGNVEHAIAHIEESLEDKVPRESLRWHAIKVFERDKEVLKRLALDKELLAHLEEHIRDCEQELDDDAEAIIIDQSYAYVEEVVKRAVVKKPRKNKLSVSDKIDRVVTNRWLALPIFAVVVWLMYFIAVQTVGGWLTDWANEGVFGEGWFVCGTVDTKAFSAPEVTARREADPSFTWENVSGQYALSRRIVGAWEAAYLKEVGLPEDAPNRDEVLFTCDPAIAAKVKVHIVVDDPETGEIDKAATRDYGFNDYLFAHGMSRQSPNPSDFGLWVPGLPALTERLFDRLGIPPDGWLHALVFDVFFMGVGTVLGFAPQIMIIFLFLAFLEDSGYMSRVAFIMDRLFRAFGLSGKSFIPMLIGMGCGVPAVMASRTIESQRDRRMTIMLATSIPCGAKYAIIAMFTTAFFKGNAFVATAMYLLGIAVIVFGGLALKKTAVFAGDPATFVMELPAYHFPSVGGMLRSMWDRTSHYIVKAGTLIFPACVIIWYMMHFNWTFSMVETLDQSILHDIGSCIAWFFAPLGFGNWEGAVATAAALVAKEQSVANLAMFAGNTDAVGTAQAIHALFDSWNAGAGLASLTGLSFLIMNLWDPPCIAAMATIWREMGCAKWGAIALLFQLLVGYSMALVVFQLGGWLFYGRPFGFWTAAAILLLLFTLYLVFRPMPKSRTATR